MVGDSAKIVDTLDEFGFDNIIEIDANGNPIVPAMIEKEKRDIKN
jgi:zinc protease